MQSFRLGSCTVEVHEGYTRISFDDGKEVVGRHDEQPGQAELAAELGYPSAEELNREHDATHALLAAWMGLPWSLTLRGVATGSEYPDWRVEEGAVLAVQRYARALGIDLVELASARKR